MEEYYGIIFFLEILNKKYYEMKKENKIKNNNKKSVFKNKIKNYIKNILLVSISVQIVIMPIILYNYKTISLTFFITNILTSFIISLIIIFGFILIIISFPLLKVAKIFGGIYKILLKLFLSIIEITSKIPFSKIYLKTPFIYEIILYYFFVFLIRIFNKEK